MVKIGVLIPTRAERLETLSKALRSITVQPFDVEVILICPQARIEVIEALARSIAGVKVKFAFDPGTGLSTALNIGFRALSDDVQFVSWLGDDDFYSSGFCEAMLRGLESNPASPFAAGFCEYVDADGVPFRLQKPRWMSRKALSVLPVQIAQPATLIRRSAILGDFVDASLKYAMDLDLWLRLASLGKPALVPEVTASYMWHPGSLSSENKRSALLESSKVRARYCAPGLRPLQALLDRLALVQLRLFGSRLDREAARQNKDNG